jgi:hypothetical protein
MLLPLLSALQNGKHFLAGALVLTTIASTLHWRHLARAHEAHAVYHNLDRLGVVLVLAQVHPGFWPLLAPLFAAGAVLQRVCAARWHFCCHLLCRYVAFWASCSASGHIFAIWPRCQIVFYTALYALHIFMVLRGHARIVAHQHVSA